MPYKFKEEKVRQHIARHYPSCPDERAEEIIRRVVSREWAAASLHDAIFAMAESHIRHNLTSYDQDLNVGGMDREAARAKVAPAVRYLIKAWRKKDGASSKG